MRGENKKKRKEKIERKKEKKKSKNCINLDLIYLFKNRFGFCRWMLRVLVIYVCFSSSRLFLSRYIYNIYFFLFLILSLARSLASSLHLLNFVFLVFLGCFFRSLPRFPSAYPNFDDCLFYTFNVLLSLASLLAHPSTRWFPNSLRANVNIGCMVSVSVSLYSFYLILFFLSERRKQMR